ncbi:MAG: transketolase [Deltaproteobacteria bacterium]|nr:MAG: transketolase [Deltaproteobacteria bacterium]
MVESEKNISEKTDFLQELTQQCRIDVFDMIHKRGNGHWGGSSSAAELLTTLYFQMMKVNPSEPKLENRDRLILSKGHAAPMLYTILARKGYFDPSELESFRTLNSRLQGHPCMNILPGVEMSTGALGHGLSVGVGMALAARVKGLDYWTFVLIGDGDLNEGVTWEAIMTAAKFKPEKLVIMVDYNKVQLDGPGDEIMPMDPLPEKFRAFNMNVSGKVYDGHCVKEIVESWEWMKDQSDWPLVVVYKTLKGSGVSFMENDHEWHGAPIDAESYAEGRPELTRKLSELRENLKRGTRDE